MFGIRNGRQCDEFHSCLVAVMCSSKAPFCDYAKGFKVKVGRKAVRDFSRYKNLPDNDAVRQLETGIQITMTQF